MQNAKSQTSMNKRRVIYWGDESPKNNKSNIKVKQNSTKMQGYETQWIKYK